MKDARAPAREAGGVLLVEPFARRFDADDLDAGIVEEGVEQPDRVRSAADRGDQHVGQAALCFQYLRACLVTDHRLEIADEFGRSEEHTSELQSLMRTSYDVFCLHNKI